jgi:hypothetical protein
MTLKHYSEWLNSGKKGEFTPQNTPKTTNFEDKMGEKWTKTLQYGSEFIFKFDYEEIEDDVDLYFGVVYWGGTEWVGCIVAEKDGSLALLDFVEDTGEFETYDNSQISSKFEPKKRTKKKKSLNHQRLLRRARRSLIRVVTRKRRENLPRHLSQKIRTAMQSPSSHQKLINRRSQQLLGKRKKIKTRKKMGKK